MPVWVVVWILGMFPMTKLVPLRPETGTEPQILVPVIVMSDGVTQALPFQYWRPVPDPTMELVMHTVAVRPAGMVPGSGNSTGA